MPTTAPTAPEPTPTLYGIPNCDTVKRARAWLAEQGQAVVFTISKNKACRPTAWTTAASRWLGGADQPPGQHLAQVGAG